ncbi:TlpA family protein disulfide reductase [Mariniradius sediminis]|uniref:TlpA family protein disulfide reductase n=1 Tax=Mariniradius sediminis TaxID=2909237 RepID=A0ABS9BVX7_9BACT|nr:TlpA disulfide reductase family protein [Mariniradius sediminis]MCF1751326.1 TlpA family protein disulfide reductase [Mariniradius sediminis]
MMKPLFAFFAFILVSLHAISQVGSTDSNFETWYSADGSNELLLLIAQDVALYKGGFWDMELVGPGKYLLANQDTRRKLQIIKDGNRHLLEDGADRIPVQAQKSSNLSNRKVGQTDLSGNFFKEDQVLLQGIFLPKAGMPSTIQVIYNHAFSDNQLQFSGEVDEKGRFKVIFPSDYPQEVMVQIGDAFFSYLSMPGAKQVMVIDESSFGGGISSWEMVKGIDFMGDLAVENEERRLLYPEFMKVRQYFLTDSLQKTLEETEFLDYRVGLMNTHVDFFNRYFDSIPVSQIVKDVSIRGARTYAADDLMRYIWLHSGIVEGRLIPVDVSDDYIRVVKNLVTDDLEDLMTSEYSGLMREFTMPMRPSESEITRKNGSLMIYSFLKEKELSESHRAGVETWFDQVKNGVPNDSLVVSNEFKEVRELYRQDFSRFNTLALWNHLKEKISDLGTLSRSSIIAIFLDMNFQGVGEDIPKSIQNQLDSLNLKSEVLAIIKQEIADFERTKNQRFVEGVAIAERADNVLSQLKDKFPGKVIYIDVWATWCGPCISEFKYAETIKKQVPEDVVFAYICGRSEREAFENQIKKFGLAGEHFFLDQDAFQKFDKEVNITGFPTYLLITKEGKLIREGIHRPSKGDELVQQLKGFVEKL